MNKCEKGKAIIRVFPRRTKWTPDDDLVFVGEPDLFRPINRNIPVKISVTFTWDIQEGERLLRSWSRFYTDVQLGGPAFNDPGSEFIPGLFIKKGVTITSRGCNKKCAWCSVPVREKTTREIEIKDGWIVQDNNILACSEKHLWKVFEMLRKQPYPAQFKGGLDTTLIKKEHRKLFDRIRVSELWFACDSDIAFPPLLKASEIFKDYPRNKKYCYALIGFGGETLLSAEKRLRNIYLLGFMPFAQLYQSDDKIKYTKEWLKLQREWQRPAIFKTIMKEEKEGEDNRGTETRNPKPETGQNCPPQTVHAGI